MNEMEIGNLPQFLSIAKASCGELGSQLHRCLDRKHIDESTFESKVDKTKIESRKIGAFMSYLKKSERRVPRYEWICNV